MADSPTFLNLLRGNRLSGFLRVRMAEGYPVRLSKDYTYAEVLLAKIVNDKGETVGKVLRNQQVELIAPFTIQPTPGYKGLVVVNPELYRFASVPSMLMFDTTEKPVQVSIPARFSRDMEPGDIDWLCRVYLIN